MAYGGLIFKFTIVGDSGVGKSALLRQLAEQRFQLEDMATVGSDIVNHRLNIDEKQIKLHIWDLAGQEKYLAITKPAFRGSAGIILVYDVTCKQSFDNLLFWLNTIRDFSNNSNIVILLVGNKSDMIHKREVTMQEGQAFAAKHELDGFLETSAKTAANVEEAFQNVAKEIYFKVEAGAIDVHNKANGINLLRSYADPEATPQKCCCN